MVKSKWRWSQGNSDLLAISSWLLTAELCLGNSRQSRGWGGPQGWTREEGRQRLGCISRQGTWARGPGHHPRRLWRAGRRCPSIHQTSPESLVCARRCDWRHECTAVFLQAFFPPNFKLLILCCRIADSQCCDGFGWTVKRLSHTYTRISSPPNSPPIQADL